MNVSSSGGDYASESDSAVVNDASRQGAMAVRPVFLWEAFSSGGWAVVGHKASKDAGRSHGDCKKMQGTRSRSTEKKGANFVARGAGSLQSAASMFRKTNSDGHVPE